MNYLNEIFANLHISYYMGSLINCSELWGESNTVLNCDKIYYILDGECKIEINGESYIGTKGMMYYIPEGTVHSYGFTEKKYLKKYWLHFKIEACDLPFSQLVKMPYLLNVGDVQELRRIFSKIIRSAKSDDLSEMLSLRSAILDVVSFYIKKSGTKSAAIFPEETKRLSEIIAYIKNNISDNITTSDLAKQFHLHPNYFIRYFKQQTGLTPVSYINKLKFEHAKHILQTTEKSISEVMESVGFNDLSNFSNFFKAYAGSSPRNFRNTFM